MTIKNNHKDIKLPNKNKLLYCQSAFEITDYMSDEKDYRSVGGFMHQAEKINITRKENVGEKEVVEIEIVSGDFRFRLVSIGKENQKINISSNL